MRGKFLFISTVVFLAFETNLDAQEVTVPAGTLLQCTLSEPNLSSKTAQVGDPLLCYAGVLHQFGQAVFPHGAYLVGRFAEYREPGRFFGKGWMKLEFDRLVLPDTSVPVPARPISVRGFKVDREGKILGRGHPKRDAVEWAIPILWPLKAVTLPMRGPRPALKGEVRVTLRLLDDVNVPVHTTRASRLTTRGPELTQLRSARVGTSSHLRYLPPVRPAVRNATASANLPMSPASQSEFSEATPIGRTEVPGTTYTLLVLNDRTIYAVTDCWLENGRIFYITPTGAEGSVAFGNMDWKATNLINAQQGVGFVLRLGREAIRN